jgi:hypothetical protein
MKEIKLQLEIRKQIVEAQIQVCKNSTHNTRNIQLELLEAELRIINSYLDII